MRTIFAILIMAACASGFAAETTTTLVLNGRVIAAWGTDDSPTPDTIKIANYVGEQFVCNPNTMHKQLAKAIVNADATASAKAQLWRLFFLDLRYDKRPRTAIYNYYVDIDKPQVTKEVMYRAARAQRKDLKAREAEHDNVGDLLEE